VVRILQTNYEFRRFSNNPTFMLQEWNAMNEGLYVLGNQEDTIGK